MYHWLKHVNWALFPFTCQESKKSEKGPTLVKLCPELRKWVPAHAPHFVYTYHGSWIVLGKGGIHVVYWTNCHLHFQRHFMVHGILSSIFRCWLWLSPYKLAGTNERYQWFLYKAGFTLNAFRRKEGRTNSEYDKCELVLTCVLRIWRYILAFLGKKRYFECKGGENSFFTFFKHSLGE